MRYLVSWIATLPLSVCPISTMLIYLITSRAVVDHQALGGHNQDEILHLIIPHGQISTRHTSLLRPWSAPWELTTDGRSTLTLSFHRQATLETAMNSDNQITTCFPFPRILSQGANLAMPAGLSTWPRLGLGLHSGLSRDEVASQHLYQTLHGMYQPSNTKRPTKGFCLKLTPSPSTLDACHSHSTHCKGLKLLNISWHLGQECFLVLEELYSPPIMEAGFTP